jgi:mevalonate kinase
MRKKSIDLIKDIITSAKPGDVLSSDVPIGAGMASSAAQFTGFHNVVFQLIGHSTSHRYLTGFSLQVQLLL